jgi:hypothetical protein
LEAASTPGEQDGTALVAIGVVLHRERSRGTAFRGFGAVGRSPTHGVIMDPSSDTHGA